MAGGIAHDFNNLLMAILGHSDLARLELPEKSPAQQHLEQIQTASERAADLCRQMLAYSGRGTFLIEPIDINQLIDELMNMLHTAVSKKAEICLHQSRDLPNVHADATQIRQVVMNLVLNASDALGEQGGTITVTTERREVSAEDLVNSLTRETLEPGPYVCVEIADTGCGMSEEVLQRIFEPFFTTKFTGRGLGLSAVLGIVKGHKGFLRVKSRPGYGTCFTIGLPAHESRRVAEPAAADTANVKPTGLILFVEDEPLLQQLGTKMLTSLGLKSIVASDGNEAVRLYQQRKSEISVIMLDMTMPYMNGEEAYRELRKIDPNVVVILASGFTESEINERFDGCPLAGFLQKPYTLATLKAALGKALRQTEQK